MSSPNPELVRQRRRADYEKHKDAYKARAKRWKTENPERYRETTAAYTLATKDSKSEYDRRYRQRHRDDLAAKGRAYYRSNAEKWRSDPKRLRRLEMTARLWREQNEYCYLCEEPLALEAAVLEHDHRCCPDSNSCCGACARGAACRWCNVALGVVHDDAERLERIARNLRRQMAVVDERMASLPEQLAMY